jgi:acetoin utilization deacetylase AcuC-like enzyme
MVVIAPQPGYLSPMPTMARTGWAFALEFLQHNAGLSHPECPERLTAIHDRLVRDGLLSRMRSVEFEASTDDQLAHAHTRRHIASMDKSEGRRIDLDT